MGGIQAITFDVGGTLIEPWPSVGHVYAEVAAQFGVTRVAPELLNHRFGAAWEAKGNFDYSRAAWRRMVRQTFGEQAGALPPEFFPVLYERFAQPDAWRIYDDVVPTLEHLARRSLRLAVISNWDERLRPLLDRLKLSRHFEAIFVSTEMGHAKPAPEIFRQAAAELKLPPEALRHIGDSAREDVAGAQAAGWQAWLLDRRSTSSVSGAFCTLADLTRWLGDGQPVGF